MAVQCCLGTVVGAKEVFSRIDRTTLLGAEGAVVGVELAEIYTPHRFWIIHQGSNTSVQLDALMDRML